MSVFSHDAHAGRWFRGIFTGPLGVLCALAIGAGCQPTDSTGSEDADAETAEPQAMGHGLIPSRPIRDVRDVSVEANPILSGKYGAPAGIVPTCVTITDGVAGGVTEDALLSGDYPGSASGPFFGAWTGVSSGGNMNYSLFKFHLDGLPTGNNVQVTSATMKVHVSWNAQNSIVGVHQALEPWNEESVTYNSYPASSWDPATAASFSAGGVGLRSFDITALAQSWINGQAANNGVVFEEAPVASHYFFTREAGDPAVRPSLQVCYIVQNGPMPWQKIIGGADSQKVASVAAGSDSSVVATGSFKGSLNLGGATFTSGGSDDIFLVKYDAQGNHLWSKQFGTPGQWHYARGTAVGPDGSIYITGEFAGTIDFGAGALTSLSTDIFLAKLDANGNALWSKRFGVTGSNAGHAVAVAPNGDVVFGGITTLNDPQAPNQLNFGGPNASLGYMAPTAAFIVRLTANGDFVSHKFANTTGGQLVKDIAVDSLGRPSLVGHMEEGVGFCALSNGSGVSMSDFNEAQLSTGFGCVWGAMIGDPFSNDEPGGVAIGLQDSVVTGGSTGVIAPFGNIVDASYAGLRVRKRGANGGLLWDKEFSNGYVRGVGVDSGDVIWVTGNNFAALDVTGGTPVSGNNSFVIRLDGSGNGLYQTSFGGSVSPSDLAVAPDDTGIVAGTFTGAANFGFGSVTANGTDAFIVKMVP